MAVEDEILGNAQGYASSMASGSMDLIMWILILVMVGGIAWYFLQLSKYNIRFRVKMLAGDRKIIIDTKAKEVTDKAGEKYLKIMKFLKNPAPLPPSDAIELNKRGKRCVEAYLVPTGEFVFTKAKKSPLEIRKWVYSKDANKSIDAVEPMTTNSRALIIEQLLKSKEDAGKTWQQWIPMVASGIVLIVIFGMALAFWGDVMEPMQEAGRTFEGASTNFLKATQNIEEITMGKQIIDTTETDSTGSGG